LIYSVLKKVIGPFHSNIEYPQKDLAFERNIFPLLFIVIRIAGEKRKKAGWVSCGLAAGLLLLGQRVKKSINSHSISEVDSETSNP
jgi:hypothetical protein